MNISHMYRYRRFFYWIAPVFFLAAAAAFLPTIRTFFLPKQKPAPIILSKEAVFYKNLTLADIRSQGEDIGGYIRDNLSQLIRYKDVDDVISLVRQGLEEKSLDMFQCHSLAHEIGHHAALEHADHLKSHLSAYNINFCGGGFVHGTEDGIATRGDGGFRKELYEACLLEYPLMTEYRECYHGAGHAFMKKTSDLKQSLALCDSLITDETITTNACYHGAFSQNMENQKRKGASNDSLLSFCASLPEKIQKICAFELNGFGISPKSSIPEIERALRSCIGGKYGPTVQAICLQSVSWAATDSILAHQKTIKPFPFIFPLPNYLRQAYIIGTTDELKRMSRNNVYINWDVFCGLFPSEEDKDFCEERMS